MNIADVYKDSKFDPKVSFGKSAIMCSFVDRFMFLLENCYPGRDVNTELQPESATGKSFRPAKPRQIVTCHNFDDTLWHVLLGSAQSVTCHFRQTEHFAYHTVSLDIVLDTDSEKIY